MLTRVWYEESRSLDFFQLLRHMHRDTCVLRSFRELQLESLQQVPMTTLPATLRWLALSDAYCLVVEQLYNFAMLPEGAHN